MKLDYIIPFIYIKNFMSVKELTLKYDSGYYRVIGMNQSDEGQDDNGSGKTCIFIDAVLYLLTGKTSKGLTGDDVFKEGKGKDKCEVSGLVEYQGKKIGISWIEGVLSLTEDGIPVETTGKKNTKTVLSDKLNLDYDILMSTLFFTNNFEYSFTRRSPSGRKEYLEELANSFVLETMKTNLGDYIRYLDSRSRLVSGCLSKLSGQISQLQKIIQEYPQEKTFTSLAAEIEDDRKRVETLKETSSETSFEELCNKLYEIEEIYGIQRDKQTKTNSEIRKLESDLSSLDKGICPTCKRDFDNPELRKEYQDSLDRSREFVSEINDRMSILSKQISDMKLKKNSISEKLGMIDRILSGIDLKNKQLEEINRITQYKLQVNEYRKKADKFSKYKLSFIDTTIDLANKFKNVLSRDLRGIVLEDYIHNFEIELNRLSVFLNKEIKLTVNKNNIDITCNNRIYEKLSTGEAKRVDIVIQETFKRLHKKRTNLFIYDEIFDGLDISGIRSIIQLLEDLSVPDSFKVIISHNPAVHDNIENAILIKVIKESGNSRLEVG